MGSFTPTPLSIPSAASPPRDPGDARDSSRDDSLQHHHLPQAAASSPLAPSAAAAAAAASSTATTTTTSNNATIHSAAGSAASTTTSPAFQQHPQLAQHKRVYQACIPCRRRKVRCDLGSVDNPHDPPCVRCRRESKECFFSATRRKRKTDDDGDALGGGGGGSDVDEYIIRNGRKKLHAADDSPGYLARFDRRQYSDVPLTPGGSHGRREPLRRPDHEGAGDENKQKSGSGTGTGSGNGSSGNGNGNGKGGKQSGGGAGAGAGAGEFDGDGDGNQTLENLEAQTVMRRVMYGPHDALDLLYKAATDRFVDLPADPLPPPRARGSADGRLLDDNHSPAATHPDYHSNHNHNHIQNHNHHGQNHKHAHGHGHSLSQHHNHNHGHDHLHSNHHHHHRREDSVASASSLPAAASAVSAAAAAATSSSSVSLHSTHEPQDPRHHHSHRGHGQRLHEQQSPYLSQGGGGNSNSNSNNNGSGSGNASSNHNSNANYSHDSVHGNGNNTGGGLGIRLVSVPSLSVKPEPQQPVDPTLTQADLTTQPGYEEALRAWSRFRFVRAGWFTAQEAIEYIDYYYKYLSPLTPISPPTFSNPASHLTLLTEEPILTVTLLTIASRYRQLPGTGGVCRSHAIPEQLWTYLRGMIERCLWGQEAFGGGFCGSGPGSTSMLSDEAQTSSTAPWRGLRKGSLRTLGTIESLLVLTEWHPRALHFPPQEATDELVLPLAETSPLMASEDEMHRSGAPGIGGRRIESWLEPAWRSDRMCWMLLSTAMGLAYELGVFDDIDEMLKDDAITRPEYKEEVYRQRANRIKRLLLIYTSQLAGRLGWTSMTPEHLRKADPAVARQRPPRNNNNNTHDDGAGNGIGNGGGGTPLTNPSSLANGFNYVPDLELDDQIIHCWAGISNAMYLGNEKLFKTRKHTTEIIQSGKYVELLREFTPLLRDWFREFELFRLPQYIRHILTIEYEYVRIYINSLSLQAVVERCTSNAGSSSNAAAATTTTTTQLSPQTMINYGKLPLGQLGGFTVHDQEYVREVVDGSRNLLRTVVQGLLPGGYLKHAPVRTYFRIISGAMFLLKTFALGAPRSDVKMSIELMDATVEALRTCVVDDVHLGIRFADLLESLTSRLRNRFIQAPMQNPSAGLRSPAVELVNGVSVPLQPGQLLQPPQQQQQQQLQALHQQQLHQQSVANAADDGATASWVSGHAQRLRDGLNGHFRPSTPDATTISATPFDLSASAFFHGTTSLGPSTPSGAAAAGAAADSNNNNNNPPGSSGGLDGTLFDDWGAAGNEMWYLPPGPAFFQNGMENGSVAMTAEGVNVGGLDLLEYMAMDPVGFPMEGGGL